MLPLRMLGLLMLIVLLCDADTLCPTELNPLILDPPVVRGQLGESVEVNCSSKYHNHYGISWSFEPDDIRDRGFISKAIPLSDWNVTAECKVELNSTHECTKELEIIVYKNPEVNMFPVTFRRTAVEGTEYELQCDLIDVAPLQNLFVCWYKDNQTIMMQNFTGNTSKNLLTESSVLRVNLSREEDGAEFRCEAQLDFGPLGLEAPVISQTERISVHYAPVFKNESDDVLSVDEGHNVTLNCEAVGNPPPALNWTCDHLNMMDRDMMIREITPQTSTNCSCTATNYLGTTKKTFTLLVTPSPTVSPLMPAAITTPEAPTPRGCPLSLMPDELVVRLGDRATANCSTSATDAQVMGWEAEDKGRVGSPPVVTWLVEKVEVLKKAPVCYITLQDDSQCNKTLDLTIYKTPDNVAISALHVGPMEEGKDYMLSCRVTNVAPVQKLKVKWYRNNETMRIVRFNDATVTPVSVSSNFTVRAERDFNRAAFRCEAELDLGPKGPEQVPTETSVLYIAEVLYKPLTQNCPRSYAGAEQRFSMDLLPCRADGNPAPSLQWFYDGKQINSSEPRYRTQSGKYTAVFTNRLGQSNTSVDITIEYSPSLTCEDRNEVQEGGTLQPTCEITGEPKPSIIWLKDGRQIETPQLWKRQDSGKYSLEARNELGIAEMAIHVDVLYVPMIKEFVSNVLVAPGENLTLNCSAEGNPVPDTYWEKVHAENVRLTPRGHQSHVSITGATSTNARVYVCHATNKVGSASRSVTVAMKDESAAVPSAVIWVLVFLLLLLFIIMLIVIYIKLRNRHGQYSFVPNSATDGSNIPLSTMSNGHKP